MKLTWIPATALQLALAVAPASWAAAAEEKEVPFSGCPAAVRKALGEHARGAKIEKVARVTEDEETVYWASVEVGGKDYLIGVDEDGTLIEFSLEVEDDEVEFSDCPAAVQKTLKEEAKGANIDQVKKEMRYGTMIYGVVVAIGQKKYEIDVAEDGTLTEKSLLFEEDEVELSDCPAAVRKTFREESRGSELGAISRSSPFGKTIYEARLEFKGRPYLLEVSEDGILISKTLDEGD